MASRINYTISLTAINTIPAQENDYTAHDMVDAQLGGSIAAQVSITPSGDMVKATSLNGFTYGPTTRYSSATPLGSSFEEFSEGTYAKVLYVKNIGKEYSTPSALGDTTTESVIVKVNSVIVCTLAPGQAVLLPLPVSLSFPVVQLQSTSINVAVEALILG